MIISVSLNYSKNPHLLGMLLVLSSEVTYFPLVVVGNAQSRGWTNRVLDFASPRTHLHPAWSHATPALQTSTMGCLYHHLADLGKYCSDRFD